MATLQLIDLAKRFTKKVWGVRKMDLEVADKEFIVLLGPSGCGKTTTMRMIAGLENVTRGTILLDDRDITDIAPRNRHVSMVFQNYAVWPHMTVFDNIAFSLKLAKLPHDVIKRRVRETADMVRIGELLKRLPGQLSGGQQQRVALARALAVKPKVFLLDEPLSNLDAKLRVNMRTEMKAIHQQTEATSIFVTHDQSEAMSMADRIVIMKDGKIVQIGTPDDVYFRSADMFVAGFIGTPPANFFKVLCSYDSGGIVLKHTHFKLEIDAEKYDKLKEYNRKEIILGVRPEDLLIASEDKAVFSEQILVIEPQGSHQVVALSFEGSIVKMVIPAGIKLNHGDKIGLDFNRERLHFFDKETEKRIILRQHLV
ncbi:MAG: ABC transporter ATP-binding protein [Spirochaetales bacterium]|nr:ABC transporter ATP-binding protein [Spirochaetales bacterium]